MPNKINIGTEIDLQDLLQSRMLIQANSGGGKSALARTLIEQSFGIVPFIILDKEGEYYTLKEKYGDVLVIGGQFADIPINLKSAKLLSKKIIGSRLSVIIDLSELNTLDKRLYVKYFLESMLHLPKEFWIGYLIFVEEAHFFCGEQDKFESGTAVKELMSTGRKRGYCGILITQRISKLHKDAAAECNNKFIGRTFLDIDIDRSAKELGFSSAKDRLALRDLVPGHFYAFGTSISPHHVHEVTINKPETKLPKAGSNLEIKPQKPTDKIKSMLAKLNDLPAEAEKELKNIQQLQAEVNRLKAELHKYSHQNVNFQKTVNTQNIRETKALADTVSKFKEYKGATDETLATQKNVIKEQHALIQKLVKEQNAIRKILNAGGDIKIPELPEVKSVQVKPMDQNFANNRKLSDKVYQNAKPTSSSNGKLGRCPLTVLRFLAQYRDRSFSKAQVGIATGYSPNSGGFNNALSELNSSGLISRDGGKLQVNAASNIEEWTGQLELKEYSIETYKNKLGKCEREIYEVLLEHPEDSFSKEQLADATESKYSYSSGGFNNALSTLNTLELIERNNGVIRLNPELLEL